MAVQRISSADQYPSSLAKRERSFAELYRQARAAQGNDNGSQAAAIEQTENFEAELETRRNREYIANLHDRVDTLRGEILARVITSAGEDKDPNRDNLGRDVSRLNNRLQSLRNKLNEEENRLSGHLLDVTV